MNIFDTFNLNDLLRDFANDMGLWSPLLIIRTLVDVGIVSYVVYKVIVLVKETRGWQLIKGVVFILVAAQLTKLLGLKTIAYILDNTVSIIALALVVVFQPELRRGLEKIGRSRFKNFFIFEEESTNIQVTALIEELVKACDKMSKAYTGALIVIERDTKIGEIINTGTQLNSNVSSELIISVFSTSSPLHDGAVIIRDNKIMAAACLLPLSDNTDLSKELGTRHRAALGLSEVSDAIVVVVSEESGRISFALNGGLKRNLTLDTLRKALNKNLLKENTYNKKLSLWKVKTK